MEIIKKISARQDFYNNKPVTIAFLGDSVTHGCFESFFNESSNIYTIFDTKYSYSSRVKEILNFLYP